MAVYAILMDSIQPKLSDKIQELFPEGNHFKINDQQWLVSAEKLVKDIGDELEMSSGAFGRFVIFRVPSSYWGWHHKRLWEWLDLKLAAS